MEYKNKKIVDKSIDSIFLNESFKYKNNQDLIKIFQLIKLKII